MAKKKNLFRKIEKKLQKRKDLLFNELEERTSDAHSWMTDHKKDLKELTKTFSETAARSAATGILLLASSSIPLREVVTLPNDNQEISQTLSTAKVGSSEDISALIAQKLEKEVPSKVRDLNEEEKQKLEALLTDSLGLQVKSSLQGFELNTNYGDIGGEQHLYRSSGDSLMKHARDVQDWLMFGPAGIAPGRGAWGYFDNDEQERYYVAVQTFLSPQWKQDPKAAYDFFRYRKVLVVNPRTGQSVVADIGDAGPAQWTGKTYGGSPEVMHFLGLGSGARKGPVLIFFIDDSGKDIPLGPITKKLNF